MMILILIAAAVISFVIACIEGKPEEFFEPALILLIVVLNAAMGMIQENRAEKALDALKTMSAPHARVIREGTEKIIRAAMLAPGDIIRLEAGDFVPADARLLEAAGLREAVMASLAEALDGNLKRRAGARMQIEALFFSNRFGVLGRTAGAEALLARHRADPTDHREDARL